MSSIILMAIEFARVVVRSQGENFAPSLNENRQRTGIIHYRSGLDQYQYYYHWSTVLCIWLNWSIIFLVNFMS